MERTLGWFVLALTLTGALKQDEDWMLYNGPYVAKLKNAKLSTTHEYLSLNALDSASNELPDAVVHNIDQVRKAIALGARFNDLPADTGMHPTSCASESSLAEFAARYKLESQSNVVGKSHFGCLQFWHSMTPVPDKPNAQGKTLYFTNEQVRATIVAEIKDWWDSSLRDYIKLANPEVNLEHAGSLCPVFKLGRILHVIQDSYAAGHVVRAGKGKSGNILMFQGYDVQEASNHDNGDNSEVEPEAYRMAQSMSNQVVQQWAKCVSEMGRSTMTPKSCDLSNLIDSIYKFEDRVQAQQLSSGTTSYIDIPKMIAGGSSKVYMPDSSFLTKMKAFVGKEENPNLFELSVMSSPNAPKIKVFIPQANGRVLYTPTPGGSGAIERQALCQTSNVDLRTYASNVVEETVHRGKESVRLAVKKADNTMDEIWKAAESKYAEMTKSGLLGKLNKLEEHIRETFSTL